jgi:uncharacterized RDD family membrane protein YckC
MPPLADSGRRTLARIIDMILVGLVVWLLSWAFNVTNYEVDGDTVNTGRSFWQSLIAALLYIAYDTFMISRTGQTLGKKWLGLRVADLGNGATPSVQTSLIRAAVLWLPFAFCCACVWTIICGGWSFFDRPYKQGLHDKAAKTAARCRTASAPERAVPVDTGTGCSAGSADGRWTATVRDLDDGTVIATSSPRASAATAMTAIHPPEAVWESASMTTVERTTVQEP